MQDDARLVIPQLTERTLAGGKLLARQKNGVLHVLFETDAAGTPYVKLDAVRLRFGLQLRNPYFSNFTPLAADFPARKLYFNNQADPVQLVADEPFVLLPPVFAHEPSSSTRPVTVSLRNAAGAVVASGTLAAGDARPALSFDLRQVESGPLELSEEFPGSTKTVLCYLDPENRPLDLAGIVEIDIAQSFYTTPPDFVIAFAARQEVLRYYVVARNYSQQFFNQLEVRDEGFAEETRPQIQFERVASASFSAAELPVSLLGSGPDQRVVLFRSTTPVARSERARRKIQLIRQNEVIIPNLPQPSASMAKAEFVIHVSKP
jgi:hypothetical protein